MYDIQNINSAASNKSRLFFRRRMQLISIVLYSHCVVYVICINNWIACFERDFSNIFWQIELTAIFDMGLYCIYKNAIYFIAEMQLTLKVILINNNKHNFFLWLLYWNVKKSLFFYFLLSLSLFSLNFFAVNVGNLLKRK